MHAKSADHRVLGLAVGLVGLLILAGLGLQSSSQAASSSAVRAGKYKGKVGTAARISFRVRRGKVTKVNAGVNALCQDTFGNFTQFQLIVVDLGSKSFKVKGRKRKFTAKGQNSDGVRYDLRGRFTASRKAKGTFEASLFRLLPALNSSELCASKQPYTAKRKR